MALEVPDSGGGHLRAQLAGAVHGKQCSLDQSVDAQGPGKQVVGCSQQRRG